MQNKQTVSTSKIIALIVFLCAALMTSLFLYHLRQKEVDTGLSDNKGMIFPVARDITPFSLVADNKQPFTQKNLINHWTLLIFGFTHCAHICPTTLDLMRHIYSDLHSTYPNLQIVLVSLDPERDSPDQLQTYMHSFHPDFIGVSGKIEDIHKLQTQLGIFSEREEGNKDDYQIRHSSSILLINPNGKWAGVFKFGLNPTQFEQAFKESMQKLG